MVTPLASLTEQTGLWIDCPHCKHRTQTKVFTEGEAMQVFVPLPQSIHLDDIQTIANLISSVSVVPSYVCSASASPVSHAAQAGSNGPTSHVAAVTNWLLLSRPTDQFRLCRQMTNVYSPRNMRRSLRLSNLWSRSHNSDCSAPVLWL